MEIKEGELLVNVVYEGIPIGIDYEGIREIQNHLNRKEGLCPISIHILDGILSGIAKDIREENYQGGEEVVFRSCDGLTKKMEVYPHLANACTLSLPLKDCVESFDLDCRTYRNTEKRDAVGRRIFEEAL